MEIVKQIKELNIDFSKYTVKEIANLLNKDYEYVRVNLRKLNIKTFNPNKKIDDFLKSGVNIEDYNLKDISKNLGMSVSSLQRILKHLGIKKQSRKVIHATKRSKPPVNINDTQHQVIIGSILGDGCISKNKLGNEFKPSEKCNSRLTIQQGEKQKEYLYYKAKLIGNLCKNIRKQETYDNRKEWEGIYISYILETIKNVSFNFYRNSWYNEGIKIISPMINTINELGLAIWFQDDGFYFNNSICLSANCFTNEELIFLKGFLLGKFNLTFTILKNKTMYLLESDFNCFKNLVLPYMHKSMLYKLNIE
jgi:AraC-like DNA-binding protein